MSLVRLHDAWRTTRFKLALLYGTMFAVGVLSLLAVIYLDTEAYVDHQAADILKSRLENYLATPVDKIPETFNGDIRRDSRKIDIYGLFSSEGRVLAGNILTLPDGMEIDGVPHLTKPRFFLNWFNSTTDIWAIAIRLSDNKILFLGRQLTQLEEIRHIIFKAILGAVIVITVGTILGILFSVRPIRRIRAMEEVSESIIQGDIALRLPVAGSDDELDLLAHIVNKMLDEIAQRMTDIKGAADSVAHDLRTPLTHLRAKLNRLLSISSDSEIQRTIAETVEEADLLLMRFRALLRISEISGSVRRSMFRDVEITSILEKVQEVYLPIAEDKNVNLIFNLSDPMSIIHGDEALLFEAFMNLVDNAIKFSEIGGWVVVRIINHDRGVSIEIENNGLCIPADEINLVLQPFYRSKINRDINGGHGVGLSIVTAILNLHGFHFTLSSNGGVTYAKVDCPIIFKF